MAAQASGAAAAAGAAGDGAPAGKAPETPAALANPGAPASAPALLPAPRCPLPRCPLPAWHPAVLALVVAPCPECEEGAGWLLSDPMEERRFSCTRCSLLAFLPGSTHKVALLDTACTACGSRLMEVKFHRDKTPLSGGADTLRGCAACSEVLNALLEVRTGAARRGGSGHGKRGRGGRGWHGGRGAAGGGRRASMMDPRMSVKDF